MIIIREKERKPHKLDRKLLSLPPTWPFALGLVQRLLLVLQLGPGQRAPATRKPEIRPKELHITEAFRAGNKS